MNEIQTRLLKKGSIEIGWNSTSGNGFIKIYDGETILLNGNITGYDFGKLMLDHKAPICGTYIGYSDDEIVSKKDNKDDITLREFLIEKKYDRYDRIELTFKHPIANMDNMVLRINSIPDYILDKKIGLVGYTPFKYVKNPDEIDDENDTIVTVFVKN